MEPREINRLIFAAGSKRSPSAKQECNRNSDRHRRENAKRATLDERNIADLSWFIWRDRGGVCRCMSDEEPKHAESEGKDWPGNQGPKSKRFPRNLDWHGSLRLSCRDYFTDYPTHRSGSGKGDQVNRVSLLCQNHAGDA